MRILGGKWTGSILWHLRGDAVRFNELARMIGGASKKMISERLRHLESHHLIERRVLATTPPGVSYQITEHGKSALRCLQPGGGWKATSMKRKP